MQANTSNPKQTKVDLSELSEEVGSANELHPKDRARLVTAYWVLGSVLALFALSGAALICVSEEKLDRAKQVFEFVKNFGPPLVTLVLGFYFREAAEQ